MEEELLPPQPKKNTSSEDGELPPPPPKKKYNRTVTIEFGFWYFRINGRSVGIRSCFYFKGEEF
jgi:hypothetical protein